MSVKSSAQFRLMEGAAHGEGYGPSKKVAEEFLKKTSEKKKKLFAREKR